jgi:hypothetical protein
MMIMMIMIIMIIMIIIIIIIVVVIIVIIVITLLINIIIISSSSSNSSIVIILLIKIIIIIIISIIAVIVSRIMFSLSSKSPSRSSSWQIPLSQQHLRDLVPDIIIRGEELIVTRVADAIQLLSITNMKRIEVRGRRIFGGMSQAARDGVALDVFFTREISFLEEGMRENRVSRLSTMV